MSHRIWKHLCDYPDNCCFPICQMHLLMMKQSYLCSPQFFLFIKICTSFTILSTRSLAILLISYSLAISKAILAAPPPPHPEIIPSTHYSLWQRISMHRMNDVCGQSKTGYCYQEGKLVSCGRKC